MTMTAQKTTNYYNFDPDRVGAHLSKGDWSGCWSYLQEILESFSSTTNPGINVMIQSDMEDESNKARIESFGALLGELIFVLLCDPNSRLPDKNFSGLILNHEILHSLFYLYGNHDTTQMIQNILGSDKSLTEGQQKKMLLLLSLRTNIDVVAALKRTSTKYRVPALMAYLSYNSIYDAHVHQNKIKLYALRHDIEKTANDYNLIFTCITTFFNCSYLDIPNRHIIKDNINKAVQRYLKQYQRDFKRIRTQNGTIDKDDAVSSKPKMAVIMEVFYKGHAMTRSWGEWIKSLGSEFDVTVLVSERNFDKSLHNVFGKVRTYTNIGEFIGVCHRLTPDIVVLPSVGMGFYGVVAANMRLAPVQIMGLGHPATTMSPFIDFVYGPAQLYHPDAFPTDKFIIDNSPYKFFPVLKKEEILAIIPPIRKANDPTPLHVAIVGSTTKISSSFLDFLAELEKESPFPLHFSFHMGSLALDTLCLRKNLSSRFKDIAYHGYDSYINYLNKLKLADIVINPFPFGHTNTLIDTLLLGKPCVGLEGTEPSSKTERYILDIVGLTDNFSAHDLADYKQKFFSLGARIINGDAPQLDRGRIYDLLYGDHQAYDFGKVIKWVYTNSDAMRRSDKKSFVALSSE
ncbi:MAG: hypothetical protein WC043_07980 [Pseudobdellovibrionaceae bacterium]